MDEHLVQRVAFASEAPRSVGSAVIGEWINTGRTLHGSQMNLHYIRHQDFPLLEIGVTYLGNLLIEACGLLGHLSV